MSERASAVDSRRRCAYTLYHCSQLAVGMPTWQQNKISSKAALIFSPADRFSWTIAWRYESVACDNVSGVFTASGRKARQGKGCPGCVSVSGLWLYLRTHVANDQNIFILSQPGLLAWLDIIGIIVTALLLLMLQYQDVCGWHAT